jgi:hypothetical protein
MDNKSEGSVKLIEKTTENKPKEGPNELAITKVVVHPLVLLSVVDHFNRMGKIGNQKRVVGILLGSLKAKGLLDISNSFAGILFITKSFNFFNFNFNLNSIE